jgi:hypothetical protein
MTLIERKIFPDCVVVLGLRYNSTSLQRLRQIGHERVTLSLARNLNVVSVYDGERDLAESVSRETMTSASTTDTFTRGMNGPRGRLKPGDCK